MSVLTQWIVSKWRKLTTRKGDMQYNVLKLLHSTDGGYELSGISQEVNVCEPIVEDALRVLIYDGLVKKIQTADKTYYIESSILERVQAEVDVEKIRRETSEDTMFYIR